VGAAVEDAQVERQEDADEDQERDPGDGLGGQLTAPVGVRSSGGVAADPDAICRGRR
jgi:hypothetical protein